MALPPRSAWRWDKRLRCPGIPAPRTGALLRVAPHGFFSRLSGFPSLLLLITEGAGRLRLSIGGGVLWAALLAALLLFPSLRALSHLVEPQVNVEFSRYGDRRPDQIDPNRFPF